MKFVMILHVVVRMKVSKLSEALQQYLHTLLQMNNTPLVVGSGDGGGVYAHMYTSMHKGGREEHCVCNKNLN